MLATDFYDYQGRRTRKITTAAAPQGASTTIYTYDLYDRLKGELDGAGNPLRTYIWRDEVPVSIIQHGTPEKAWYLEVDHLNTPLAARDQTGKVIWQWTSDAFGSALPNEDPDGDTQKTTINLRFPGQYYDKESGLHYNYRRYYDPRLGRYLSPDPIGLAGGGNLYSYVNGNPLRYIDPQGTIAINLGAAGLGSVIGGVAGGVTVYLQGGSSGDIASATFIGAAGGAVAGFTLGAAGSLVVGGVSSGLGNVAGQIIAGNGFSPADAAISTVVGITSAGWGLLARAAGYSALAETATSGLAGAETQGLIDWGRALNKAYPAKNQVGFCPAK